MIRTLTLSALSAALIATTASAQQTPPATAQPAQTTTTTTAAGRAGVNDQLFAQAAAIGGLAEVQLAEMGVQKATDPELKRFSQQMVEEHTRMNAELTALAAQQQLALPRAVDPRAAFCAQSLAGLSGEEFDKCYAKAQLVIHLDSLATFEAEAERGMNPQVKALAARSVPHIREHLRTVRPIAMRYMRDERNQQQGQPGHSDAPAAPR